MASATRLAGVGDFSTDCLQQRDGLTVALRFEQQFAPAFLRRNVGGEFFVNGDGFGRLALLFVKRGQLQHGVVESGIQLRGGAIVFGGVRQAILPRQSPRQSQLGGRGFGIDGQRGAKVRLSLRRIARSRERFRQVKLRTVHLGFCGDSGVEIRRGFGRLLVGQQQHAKVQLCFVQARFQLECFAVFGNGQRRLVGQAVAKREVEMRCVIFGIGRDGLAE